MWNVTEPLTRRNNWKICRYSSNYRTLSTTNTTFKDCTLVVYSLNLPPCFRNWEMSIKGKTALVTGAATGIGLQYVKALLKNGAQVSYYGWLHSHVREVVETLLHSHDTLRGSGCFVDKQSCYLLCWYFYQRPEFVTTVVHGSTIHFSTIIANCCNISHSRYLPRHFIFRHKQIINVLINVGKVWREMAVWHTDA